MHWRIVIGIADFVAQAPVSGPLAYGESFIDVPLPSLGGSNDVANRRTRPGSAMRILLELQGPVPH